MIADECNWSFRRGRSVNFLEGMADDFCEKNFQCNTFYIEGPHCKVFFKGEQDVNCHIPCRVENCSYAFVEHDLCQVHNCIGIIGPSTKDWNISMILGVVTANFAFLICGLFAIWFLCRRFRGRSENNETQNLINQNYDPEDNSTNPIIRSSSIRLSDLRNLVSPPSSEGGQSPPPSYNSTQLPGTSQGATAYPEDKPFETYTSTVDALEKAYRKVRAKSYGANFDAEEVQQLLITALVPATELKPPRHELLAVDCACYECFLKNLEESIKDNIKEEQ